MPLVVNELSCRSKENEKAKSFLKKKLYSFYKYRKETSANDPKPETMFQQPKLLLAVSVERNYLALFIFNHRSCGVSAIQVPVTYCRTNNVLEWSFRTTGCPGWSSVCTSWLPLESLAFIRCKSWSFNQIKLVSV